ncbi:MAG: hypothetical protein P8Q54_07755 [Akkermansiaceae bacterium]|nr:hypothetical protein [Akkermansiaceae bacterium]
MIHIKLKQGKFDMFNQQHVKTRTVSLTFYSVAAILLTATARCAEQQADESKIDEKKRDVDGVRFDMGSERYRFKLIKIKT